MYFLPSGVVNMTLRIPPTRVPAETTTYMCYGFLLPNDTDYHVIAITPVINTSAVLHHMLLYACKDDPGNSEYKKAQILIG